jgi:putative component of toxin-antitoxin plasmid stabilization module
MWEPEFLRCGFIRDQVIRIYFVRQGRDLFLLTGGVKDSQMRDIRRARELLREGS